MDAMRRFFPHVHASEIASAAVWCCLGAALVIHGCSSPEKVTRREPVPAPRSTPAVAQAPAPAPAPAAPVIDPFQDRPLVPSAEPDLRVRIAAFRNAGATPRLSSATGTLVLAVRGVTARNMRSPVDVRFEGRGWVVTEAAGSARPKTFDVAATGPIELRPTDGARGTVTFDGVQWPGAVRCVPGVDGPDSLDLVVDVPLERYLPGVLAKELLKNWSPETFRAQAIAARSFAVCEHAHWQDIRHYDLVAGEASQAWVGEVKEERPRNAVAQTRGMVLVFDGRVVPAYYSSTCGGTPANATDAVTRNPHHGVAPLAAGGSAATAHRDCCADAPKFRWEQTMTSRAICAQLRRWSGDQLAAQRERGTRTPAGTVARARPAPSSVAQDPPAAGASARAVSAVVAPGAVSGALPGAIGAPGTDDTDTAAEASPGASSNAGATAGTASGITEIAADAPLLALSTIQGIRSIQVSAQNAAGRPTRLTIVDARGQTLQMRAEDFRRAVNYAREGEKTPAQRLNSSCLARVTVQGDRITFNGSGFGHGVGMCQYGAESLARRGQGAEQILSIYYPQATVQRAY